MNFVNNMSLITPVGLQGRNNYDNFVKILNSHASVYQNKILHQRFCPGGQWMTCVMSLEVQPMIYR